jgi:thymidine kinase
MAKLYFYYSAMNAGKSTNLLQSAYNYKERGMDTLLYTAKIDNRVAVGKIASRIGLESSAQAYYEHFDLFEDIQQKLTENPNIKCIFIDEAQFLNKTQVSQLSLVTIKLHVPVVCYGLRSDFLGEPFEGSKYLLAWADSLTEIKTICYCGKKATMNLRLDNQGKVTRAGEQVEIGGNDKYVAVCREHFVKGEVH